MEHRSSGAAAFSGMPLAGGLGPGQRWTSDYVIHFSLRQIILPSPPLAGCFQTNLFLLTLSHQLHAASLLSASLLRTFTRLCQ
jgi:hypothetical protein